MKLTAFHIGITSILFVLPTSVASSSETTSFLRSSNGSVDNGNGDTTNGIALALVPRGITEDGTEEDEDDDDERSSTTDTTAIHSNNGNENDSVDITLWPFHGSSDNDDTNSKSVKDGITFERTETTCPLFQYDFESGSGSSSSRLTMWQKLSSASLLEYAFTSFFKFIPAQFRVVPPSSFFGTTRTTRTTTTPQQPSSSSSSSSPYLTFDDGHCESQDEYGGNVCHYDWGEDIAINYDGNVNSGVLLDGDVYIEVSAKIDNLLHHSQTCPICGPAPCTIALASSMLPSSWKWSIDLPPCPLTFDFLSGTWAGSLPLNSPVPSLGFLGKRGEGTVVEGTVWLKRKKSGGNPADDDEGDIILMEVKGNVHLK